MKKKIITFALVATMIFNVALASSNSRAVTPVLSIQGQADALIASVDKTALMADAVENVVDPSVPASVRSSISANADFVPAGASARSAIQLDVNSTVQKIGEIVDENGNISNMYVAVAAVEPKMDENFEMQYGIRAWSHVYWIDNYGSNNQLHSVWALWRPDGKEVDNRQVRYGTSNMFGTSWYDNGPTIKYPTSDSAEYKDSSYSGLTLRCETKVDVLGSGGGTVYCNVISKNAT